jgi:hypothetical protein
LTRETPFHAASEAAFGAAAKYGVDIRALHVEDGLLACSTRSSTALAARLLPLLAACAAALVLAAAAQAAPRPPTPTLIDRAAHSGKVTPRQRRLLLARALSGTGDVPDQYESRTPWDGTLPLLHLRQAADRLPAGQRKELNVALAGTSCAENSASLPNSTTSTHFQIDYGAIGAGLNVNDYKASLDESWTTEISAFGWAEPPQLAADPPNTKYYVRLEDLSGDGLYGFVSAEGSHAGEVGDNPHTPWNDQDASASCMVINSDFTGFSTSPQAALDATTAHEFNHSIQYGYGGLEGPNTPDDAFTEGGATWMEDEAQGTANDNYLYLWPVFTDSMGEYDDSPYPYWITFRGITERYGTGVAGGGEDVMQRFWEETSKGTGDNLTAMQTAVAGQPDDATLATAFHDYAVAVKFNETCGGGYVYPFCFQEGGEYVKLARETTVTKPVPAVGNSVSGQIEDNYSLAWIALPAAPPAYDVALTNPSAGGQLRFTVACDTGTEIARAPGAAQLVGPGGSAVVRGVPDCAAPVAVITNERQVSADPEESTFSSYVVSTSATGDPTLNVSRTGTGTGTVTSTPGGIDCGEECGEQYPLGTLVTLTASPTPGSAFVGWGGACSGASIQCKVPMSAARTVTARFDRSNDLDPPQTTIESGPAALSSDTTPTFRFASDEPNSSFRCRIGSAEYVICRSPFTPTEPLADGRYTFQVFAVDPSGNADPTPSSMRFTVDRSVKPDTRAPTLRRLRLSARHFRAAGSGPDVAIITTARVGTGARLSLDLSEVARLRMQFDRSAGKGHWRRRGVIAVAGVRGRNLLRLRGRLKGVALKPGLYRLVLTARDAADNVSKPKKVAFRIVP